MIILSGDTDCYQRTRLWVVHSILDQEREGAGKDKRPGLKRPAAQMELALE